MCFRWLGRTPTVLCETEVCSRWQEYPCCQLLKGNMQWKHPQCLKTLKNIVFFNMIVFTLEAGPIPARKRQECLLHSEKEAFYWHNLCWTWSIFSRPSMALLCVRLHPLAVSADSAICLFIYPVNQSFIPFKCHQQNNLPNEILIQLGLIKGRIPWLHPKEEGR